MLRRRRLPALLLAIAAIACTGGTGTSTPSGSADGGPSADTGEQTHESEDASADASAASCGTMEGSWHLAGMCGDDRCEVSQDGCNLHVLCNASIDYRGSVSGTSFTYAGKDGDGFVHTCTGTIQGSSLAGSCSVTSSGSCMFTATKS